jgi:hypothetical protein
LSSPFRIYRPQECGDDGYPRLWHKNVEGALDDLIAAEFERGIILDAKSGMKHVVRAQAGHRCLRCKHPFLVGSSGTMEGPTANAKAFAANLGLDLDTVDQAFLEGLEPDLSDKEIETSPRVNWSRCDDQCRHGGVIRARGIGEWELHKDASPGQADLLIAAQCKVEAAWRILTVHHLNEVKADLRWWNLVALCQRCHLLIQRKVTMDQPWPWQHTDWFQPFAAGFYAMKYLDLDLSRDEAEARMEELLALGAEQEALERMPI